MHLNKRLISLRNNALCPIDSARCFAYKDYPEPEKSTIRGQIEKASVNRPSIPSTHIFSQLACLLDLFIQAVRWTHLSIYPTVQAGN